MPDATGPARSTAFPCGCVATDHKNGRTTLRPCDDPLHIVHANEAGFARVVGRRSGEYRHRLDPEPFEGGASIHV